MFCFCGLKAHFLCFLALVFGTSGHENGPEVVTVVVSEGSDAFLPCSVSTSLVQELFDWRKDQNKQDVFMYENYSHYNNGLIGQHDQFKGRVSHFQQQLQFGNASIVIRNTTISDGGNYTCHFPNLEPEQIFSIKLVVRAAPKPIVWLVKDTEDQVQLHCVVPGAFPKPEVLWKESNGDIVPAEPQVLYRGDHYYITLLITVTATNTGLFHCVATQEEIGHVIDAEIRVPDKQFKSSYGDGVLAGLFCAGFVTGASVVLVLCVLYVRKNYIKKVSAPKTNGSCNGESSQPLQPL
ncbi:butyrophilin subfamily 3 member A3-like isoform X2 [Pundamilia nyererei]|uniref:Butyrophilin subfamily 3 member A3-like isoform X2 n=1 Tax=Pundamilia nyererei TaxID=303518 RepID=A0A9Y3S9U9_9CICH|nr:PREDICTED: butyrophilin subfamily 3 member A3-like isoform X2 [Pundamilia nyererei]